MINRIKKLVENIADNKLEQALNAIQEIEVRLATIPEAADIINIIVKFKKDIIKTEDDKKVPAFLSALKTELALLKLRDLSYQEELDIENMQKDVSRLLRTVYRQV